MSAKKRGWGSDSAIQTGRFIRDFLSKHGEAYAYQVWRALKEKRASMGLRVGSPIVVYRYFKMLKEMGMVEETGRVEETSKKSPIAKRKYYRIIGDMNSPIWEDVQKEYWKTRKVKH